MKAAAGSTARTTAQDAATKVVSNVVSGTPLLILAGGKATRLAHLSQHLPKYLQPISEQANFADVHLRWARKQGFERVILSIGHLGEMIRAHCGDGSRYGLKISYLDDGPLSLGTGGAVRGALVHEFSELAVTYGDTMLSVDVSAFLTGFHHSGLDAGMTLFQNTVAGHVCNADLQGAIAHYNKLKPKMNWAYIDYGFLVLRRQAAEAFPERVPLDLSEPLSLLSERGRVFGFRVQERFWEIGSPEALAEFRSAFQSDFGTQSK